MKQVKNLLTMLFWAMLVAALALVALYETDTLEPGIGAGQNASLEFVLTTLMELLTLAAAYLSLRLFRFSRVHADLVTRQAPALRQWGVLRLLLIGMPMVADTFLYYMYMNPTFGYLAIILALCLPFVYPGMNRCVAETTEEV